MYDEQGQTWYFVECSEQPNSAGSAAAAEPDIKEYDVFRDLALPNFQPDRYEGDCPDPYAGR